MMRIPTWHEKSDEELAGLIRAAWEGRLVGTWQFKRGAPVLDQLFPGYEGFYWMASMGAVGGGVVFESPASARAWGGVPLPQSAYGVLPEGVVYDPRATTRELPRFPEWEMLSWPEWKRVRARLGYPPPAPSRAPAEEPAP